MVKALQGLGDRIVGRFVPEVVAEASVQDYSVFCYCKQYQLFAVNYRKDCVPGGGCGPCIAAEQPRYC
jgi:hypothetical protein